MARAEKLHGVLLIDKPLGVTSHDAVATVRKIIGQREVGHTGTLDPLASGLLVLCLGRATKVSQFLSECDKGYTATIRLGLRSSTFDAEGVDTSTQTENVPETLDETLQKTLAGFVGRQDQQVPPHASVRLNGRHMYDMTRSGETFDRPVRTVTISSLEVISYHCPDITVQIACGKGTYIRSLANDVGERLGCGAYLAELRRSSVGRFSVANAVTLEQLQVFQQSDMIQSRLVSISDALELSSMLLADGGSEFVSHGRSPRWQDVLGIHGTFRTGDRILLTDSCGGALAVAIAGADSVAEHSPTSNPVDRFVRVLA